ncbi:hypothetical protein AMTRI_Chr07g78470 [Amborella trichopoda]
MKAGVLYYYRCPDGAFAALAAHLYFSSTSQPALFFSNCVHDLISLPPLNLPFSFPIVFMITLGDLSVSLSLSKVQYL